MESYIGRTLGDFEIVRELGKGGQGFVFLARQISLKRDVALKVIPVPVSVSSNQVRRFTREAEATAKLKHHNIVEVYQIGQEVGNCFYAMEVIDGWSLDRIIAGMKNYALTGEEQMKVPQSTDEPETLPVDHFHLQEPDIILPASPSAADESDEDDEQYDVSQAATVREDVAEGSRPQDDETQACSLQEDIHLGAQDYDRLPPDYYLWAAKIIHQAANALHHAHENGIIHRDIKPSNLMVSREDAAKITDFGLARDIGEETITVTGRPMGTPAYMSPEQIRARITTIDKRTDIYSLGVTLYEAISLDRPFRGQTTRELYDNISVKEPKDPRRINPHVPRDLAVIALKAVEKDPDRRYQSAQEMADDLNRYLSDVPIVAKPPTLVDKAIKFAKRNRVQVSAASLAAVVLILILGVIWAVQTSGRRTKIREFLEEARQAEVAKEYDNALKFYEKVLAIDADHVDARIKSAELEGKIPRLRAEAETQRGRGQAERLVEEGEALVATYSRLKSTHDNYQQNVKKLSKDFRGHEPIEEKKLLWEAQDKVKETQDKITDCFGSAVNRFVQALSLDPECKPAKSNLAKLYWRRFTEAEKAQSRSEMRYFAKLVQTYDTDERYTEKLKGDGTIEVTSDPRGTEVYLYEYVEKHRILTPSNERKLGVTPIPKQPLAMGSYLLILKHEGYRDVRYPLLIERQEDERASVKIYTDEEIGEDFIYVPGGEFIMGGDERAYGSVERQTRYVEGFFIAKFEVTCGEYLQFLNDLARQDPKEAGKHVPRRSRTADHYWKKGNDGKYICRWDLKWPVSCISWYDAEAYVRWKSSKDGMEYGLPMDAQWEKAARGVDGRIYPWGNHFDPTFCKMMLSREGKSQPEPIGTFGKDKSPYGVQDMAGGVGEWCGGLFDDKYPQMRLERGGSWSGAEVNCRTALRGGGPASDVRGLGFRIARNIRRTLLSEPSFDLRLVPVRQGIWVSSVYGRKRTSLDSTPFFKAAKNAGLDVDRPTHPLMLHAFRKGCLFYLFYTIVDNALGDRPYLIQRVKRTVRNYASPADTHPETMVTFHVEVLKTDGVMSKVPDQHLGGYKMRNWYKREIIKEYEIGFGSIKGIVAGVVWPFRPSSLGRVIQQYRPDPGIYDQVEYTYSKTWTLSARFDNEGNYSISIPELSVDAPASLPDPEMAAPRLDPKTAGIVLEEGRGVFGLVAGKSGAQDIARILGPPLQVVRVSAAARNYSHQKGLTFNVYDDGPINTIVTRSTFAGKTSKGIAHGDTRRQVIDVYGEPKSESDIFISFEGVTFWLDSVERVTQIVIYEQR